MKYIFLYLTILSTSFFTLFAETATNPNTPVVGVTYPTTTTTNFTSIGATWYVGLSTEDILSGNYQNGTQININIPQQGSFLCTNIFQGISPVPGTSVSTIIEFDSTYYILSTDFHSSNFLINLFNPLYSVGDELKAISSGSQANGKSWVEGTYFEVVQITDTAIRISSLNLLVPVAFWVGNNNAQSNFIKEDYNPPQPPEPPVVEPTFDTMLTFYKILSSVDTSSNRHQILVKINLYLRDNNSSTIHVVPVVQFQDFKFPLSYIHDQTEYTYLSNIDYDYLEANGNNHEQLNFVTSSISLTPPSSSYYQFVQQSSQNYFVYTYRDNFTFNNVLSTNSFSLSFSINLKIIETWSTGDVSTQYNHSHEIPFTFTWYRT